MAAIHALILKADRSDPLSRAFRKLHFVFSIFGPFSDDYWAWIPLTERVGLALSDVQMIGLSLGNLQSKLLRKT